MSNELPHGLLIPRGAVLDHAVLKRADEVDCEAVFERIGTAQDGLPQDALRNEVLWVAHIAVDPLPLPVAGGNRTPRCSQIYANIQAVICGVPLFRRHRW